MILFFEKKAYKKINTIHKREYQKYLPCQTKKYFSFFRKQYFKLFSQYKKMIFSQFFTRSYLLFLNTVFRIFLEKIFHTKKWRRYCSKWIYNHYLFVFLRKNINILSYVNITNAHVYTLIRKYISLPENSFPAMK